MRLPPWRRCVEDSWMALSQLSPPTVRATPPTPSTSFFLGHCIPSAGSGPKSLPHPPRTGPLHLMGVRELRLLQLQIINQRAPGQGFSTPSHTPATHQAAQQSVPGPLGTQGREFRMQLVGPNDACVFQQGPTHCLHTLAGEKSCLGATQMLAQPAFTSIGRGEGSWGLRSWWGSCGHLCFRIKKCRVSENRVFSGS